jgi:uroporphyrinogen-III synthase
MSGLAGMRVALLEGRMSGELAGLVRRHGGEPHCVPAVREEKTASADGLAEALDQFAAEASPVIVISTGVGVAALFSAARALARGEELRDALRSRVVTVCRGPKPIAALKREGLEASVRAREPYTTADLLEALSPIDLRGRYVAVLHYGERNTPLVEALERRGARLGELMLYEWKLPEDSGPLRALVDEIIDGRLGAVLFTSQVQARHLFQIAAESDRDCALREALQRRTVVGAVGPTCAKALERLGVPPHVVPVNPKMGPLVVALAAYVENQRPSLPLTHPPARG